MDETVGVGYRVESEQFAAQRDRRADLAREEGFVDGLVGIGGKHAQRDPRMAVVETTTRKSSVAIDDVDEGARRGPGRRFLDHLLEDPGMSGAAFDLETDQGQGARGFAFHRRMIAVAAGRLRRTVRRRGSPRVFRNTRGAWALHEPAPVSPGPRSSRQRAPSIA